MNGSGTNMVGCRFGRLVVIAQAKSPDEYRRWRCVCDCGKSFIARGHTLRAGKTKSCGCYRREHSSRMFTTHGATIGGFSLEYNSYRSMLDRCRNPQHQAFRHYGGRGITVCKRWLKSFANFYADMGPRPSPLHSLDRKNNNGPYAPRNCRWATRKEQSRNSRNAKSVQRSDRKKFRSAADAAESVSGSMHSVRAACITGRRYRGFMWRFAEATIEAHA